VDVAKCHSAWDYLMLKLSLGRRVFVLFWLSFSLILICRKRVSLGYVAVSYGYCKCSLSLVCFANCILYEFLLHLNDDYF